MTTFGALAALIVVSALFSYVNLRFVHLPTAIGIMSMALVLSLVLVTLGKLGLDLGFDLTGLALSLLEGVDFERLLLRGMLGFLLFAGALHIEINDLSRAKGDIAMLATFGVLTSTVLVGGLAHVVFSLLGYDIPWIECFLFGALISPTDPIAVVGMLKEARVPEPLQTRIAGESMFNDGVGVALFIALLEIARGETMGFGSFAAAFALEVGGGLVFGLAAGAVVYRLLRGVDSYEVEVLLTIALAMGVYSASHRLHVSGPIAVVVAGLLIGNYGKAFAMSPRTQANLHAFWAIVDELLNAVLFLLIGFEVLVVPVDRRTVVIGLALVPVVLSSRWISTAAALKVVSPRRALDRRAVDVMTWSGLRGGISVALALSIPAALHRDVLLAMTYVIVIFSVLVQGLTAGAFARRRLRSAA